MEVGTYGTATLLGGANPLNQGGGTGLNRATYFIQKSTLAFRPRIGKMFPNGDTSFVLEGQINW